MTNGSTRAERLQIMLSGEELTVLDDFRFRKRMPSRAAAIRELLKRGLAAEAFQAAAFGAKSEEFGVIGKPPDGREIKKHFRNSVRAEGTLYSPYRFTTGANCSCVWCDAVSSKCRLTNACPKISARTRPRYLPRGVQSRLRGTRRRIRSRETGAHDCLGRRQKVLRQGRR